MLESWEHGVAVTLTRNPHYWREGKPYLDKVVFQYVPDDNTRVLQLESGDCNVASAIPHSQVDRLKGIDGLDVLVEAYYAWNTLLLRNTQAPLDDKAVRQALAYATPREAILKTVLFGYAELATSQIGPNEFNNPDVAGYPYDMDKARSLLASSSAPDGFELTISIASGDSVSKQTAQVIQQEWANLGVNVTVEEADIGTAIDNWYSGKSQSFLTPAEMLSSDTLSNDELSFIFFSPDACCDSFFTGYSNPEAIAILEEANGSLDEAVRQAKFYELQQLTMDDTATITMFNTLARTGIRREVQNFHTVPTGWWNLDEVSLAQ
jgi:peptide/nickel transport system substrate-binding protein